MIAVTQMQEEKIKTNVMWRAKPIVVLITRLIIGVAGIRKEENRKLAFVGGLLVTTKGIL